jgi:alanine racemase
VISDQHRPTRAVVDLAAIRHNVAVLRETAAPAELCAVVKADGYGHGAAAVAAAAVDAGATWLAVALVEEGQALRAAGIEAPILVLAEPPTSSLPAAIAADLAVTIYSSERAAQLDEAARVAGTRARAHLKVDTGMHRVGVPRGDWDAILAARSSWLRVEVEAVWTHLACADEPGNPVTDEQLDRFEEFLARAEAAGLRPATTHAANSAAALIHPRARRDLVRVGIALYGLSPGDAVAASEHGLRPALELVTEVSFVKRVPAGSAVSYGHTWTAPTEGWLATLPIGYADGVPRLLSNRAAVVLGGRRRPIVGTVCMDQLLVWCGDDRPEEGDEVVLLGRRGDEAVTGEEWAGLAGTITYEIVCGLGARVPREYRDGDG